MLMGRDLETNKFVVDAKCNIPATPRGNEQSQSGPSLSARSAYFELQGQISVVFVKYKIM